MERSKGTKIREELSLLMVRIRKKLDKADDPGWPMSRRERRDLGEILFSLNTILKEVQEYERAECERTEHEMPVRHSNQYLNTQCEFFDMDANRIQCAIGCDMYHCSKRCIYATNVPGSMPPYCTKYMKGRL